MNKNLYRLIFNSRRNIMIPVAELTSAHQKNKGERNSKKQKKETDKNHQTFVNISVSALVSLMMNQLSFAQIIANADAPAQNRPIILNTANNIPQINITTPTASGLSRNQYSQFDVSSKGAILNNSRSNTETLQAGWITGNPLIGANHATTILNEISSSNPSFLNGYIEVAGNKANVIIANPSGISCNGCGFVQAPSVSLIAGTPTFQNDDNNQLDRFSINQNANVTILGNGLDATRQSKVDLLAGAINLNGFIWSNNDVSAKAQSLDIGALGGVYGQNIYLVAQKEGLGVNSNINNLGELIANQNIELKSDGTIANHNFIQAGNDALITGKNTTEFDNKNGFIHAGNSLTIQTNDLVQNDNGILLAKNNVKIDVFSGTINSNKGTIAAGVLANGQVATGMSIENAPSLNLNAKNSIIGNDANFSAAGGLGNISVFSDKIDTPQSIIYGNNITINTNQGGINLSGSYVRANQMGNLTINTKADLNTSSANIAFGGLGTLSAKNWDNTKGSFIGLATKEQAQERPDNLYQRYFDLQNTVTNNKNIFIGKTLEAEVQDNINNQNGLIASNNTGVIASKTLNNQSGKINLFEGGDFNISDFGTLNSLIQYETDGKAITINNHKGLINSNGNLNFLTSPDLQSPDVLTPYVSGKNSYIPVSINNNQGTISGKSVEINFPMINNEDGFIYAEESLTTDRNQRYFYTPNYNNDSLLNNKNGVIQAKDLYLTTRKLNNENGIINANNNLEATIGKATNDGLIQAKNTANFKVDHLTNSATGIINAKNITIKGATQYFEDTSFVISTLEGLLTNEKGGKILAGENIDIGLNTNANQTGKSIEINNQGLIQSKKEINIFADNTIQNSGIIASEKVYLQANNQITNQATGIIQGKTIDVYGTRLDSVNLRNPNYAFNNFGVLSATTINADKINNQTDALITNLPSSTTNKNESLTLNIGEINNFANAIIDVTGNLTTSGHTLINTGGQITSKGVTLIGHTTVINQPSNINITPSFLAPVNATPPDYNPTTLTPNLTNASANHRLNFSRNPNIRNNINPTTERNALFTNLNLWLNSNYFQQEIQEITNRYVVSKADITRMNDLQRRLIITFSDVNLKTTDRLKRTQDQAYRRNNITDFSNPDEILQAIEEGLKNYQKWGWKPGIPLTQE